MPILESTNRKLIFVSLAFILVVGVFLRLPPSWFDTSGPLHSLAVLHPSPKWHNMRLIGVDEELYRGYVDQLNNKGLRHYPDIVLGYIEKQVKLPGSILPPVRFFYIFAAHVWHSLFGTEPLTALRSVASFFNILTLGIAALLAWRVRKPTEAIAVTALVVFAPTQIHMSQHALVDGIFSFWALLTLWLLWENLQSPKNWGWLCGYTASLAFVLLTKAENCCFVWIAIVIVLIANHWLKYGTVTRELIIATVLGPLLGVVILILLSGGADVLFGTYRLLIAKNLQLPYAIKTGDGPWYRYLVDLMLVSPIIVLLAIGALFRIDRTKRFELFLLAFIGGSYLVMCNLKYGMNLRYANMWDVPLRFLAVSALVSVIAPLRKSRELIFVIVLVLICALELRQYMTLFVDFPLYELVPEGLLRALHILK
ncbi:MAG TPA: hypothetical protein VGM62_03540 [Chthoniobacterales bacterium]